MKKTTNPPKAAKTKDDWIAAGWDEAAVVIALEGKPDSGSKAEIWDEMLQRFKLWMVTCAGLSCGR